MLRQWAKGQGACAVIDVAPTVILPDCSHTSVAYRFVTYVCYAPKSFMSPDELAQKEKVFRRSAGTTHWPHKNIIPAERPNYHNALPRRPDDSLDPANRTQPLHPASESATIRQLAGIVA